MLLFGHRLIESEKFYHISDTEQLVHTPPSSIIYVEFHETNLDIINYLRNNEISFVLNVHSISEAVLAENLGARYIAVDAHLAKSIQNLAEHYLFDAKVLVHSDNEADIEELALLGIDGILFREAVIKVS